MPSDPAYERYHIRVSDLQGEFLRRSLAPDWGAKYRSLLVQSPLAFVSRSSALRRPRQAQPESGPWIEHVRDGVAVTKHGARLLES